VTNPSAIVAADFNRDGKTDLAVVDSISDSVVIFLGLGNGTFAPFFSATVGQRPLSLVAADFKRDGITDLAVTNSLSGDVSVLLGYGLGTFQPAGTFRQDQIPLFLRWAISTETASRTLPSSTLVRPASCSCCSAWGTGFSCLR
jgi:hypothetical protein